MALVRALLATATTFTRPSCVRHISHSWYLQDSQHTDQGSTAPFATTSTTPEHQQQQPQRHWLDTHFPGVRQWLERKSREWWMRAIKERCRQYPALHGRDAFVLGAIDSGFTELWNTYKHKAMDERANTHIQAACLTLATHKVLQPYIKDSEELNKILRSSLGEQTSPLFKYIMRYSLLLSRDPYGTMVRRLNALRIDYGPSFEGSIKKADGSADLVLSRCLYHEVFDLEGKPELTACACCSQDATWFQGVESTASVAFKQPSSIANGQSCCVLQVAKT